MIIPQKKRAAAIIVAHMNKPKDGYSEGGSIDGVGESEMSPHLEAKAAHADSMIEAMHNKDPHALVSAMNNFLAEHELHQEEEGEEESDYKPGE